MDVIKKSFELTGDTAQLIDEFVGQNPGMSFTLIANLALEQWLANKTLSINFKMPSQGRVNTVKKSVNFKTMIIEQVDALKHEYPGMNTTLVLNAAIIDWLKKPSFKKPKPITDSDISDFLDQNSDLMDELAK